MEQINPEQNTYDVSPVFFPVSPNKLVIMSICTFGLYELYWFYRNWKFLKEKRGLNISPFARAWFSIIFCYDLFAKIKSYAKINIIEVKFNPAGIAATYILLSVMWILPDPGWLISVFTFAPLLTIQKVINKLNGTHLEKVMDRTYTPLNITGIIIGGILWLMAFFGMIPY